MTSELLVLELETKCYSLRAQLKALNEKIERRGAVPRYLKRQESLLAKLKEAAEDWRLEKFLTTFSIPMLDPIQVMGDTSSFPCCGHP